ncbi:MAG: HAD family phosphatase [Bacteroidales bacterium]
MKKIKGVLFDFNGTLYWDTPLHNRAWDQFLDRHRISLTDEEKDRRIHGKNNRDIMRILFGRDLDPAEFDRYSKEKEDIYQAMCLQQNLQLADGTIPLFDFLKDKGIPFTIATAADLYNMNFYFSHLGLGRWFDLRRVVYSDGTIKSKPDPEIFFKAAEVLGLSPDDLLVFEDSYGGIQAAEGFGAGTIFIVDSTGADYSAYPHRIIRSFDEVDRSMFEY